MCIVMWFWNFKLQNIQYIQYNVRIIIMQLLLKYMAKKKQLGSLIISKLSIYLLMQM